jgi:hypothetical protein
MRSALVLAKRSKTMPNLPKNIETAIAENNAKNAETSAALLALVQAMPAAIADAVKAAIPAPTTRAPRTARVAMQMSPADADAAMCGFVKKGPRRDFFLALRGLADGVYPLSDFAGVSLADAQVVYRRLSGNRTGGRVTESFFDRLGFSLAIDNETRGKADVIVTRKADEKAADEVVA